MHLIKAIWIEFVKFIFFLFIATVNAKSPNKDSRNNGICPPPPDFPSDITLISRPYENWTRDVTLPLVWIAIPKIPEDVATLANWAYLNDFRIRAKGGGHNFSPFLLSKTEASMKCPKVFLVDTKKYLRYMSLGSDEDNEDNIYVTVETGTLWGDLLEYLENKGHGVYSSPSVGDITVGGALAVAAHGTGIPASADSKSHGQMYGSLSNLIVSMTIIAWDYEEDTYTLKTIHRSEKDCKAFLTHLGRAFVTSVSLRIGKNQNLRTISEFQISNDELFAPPQKATMKSNTTSSKKQAKYTLSSIAEKYGRLQIIVFPFQKYPWLMLWSSVPEKPESSKIISKPYPYSFINFVPQSLDLATAKTFQNFPFLGKFSGQFALSGAQSGVTLTGTKDLWGHSKNHYLTLARSTAHLPPSGFTVLTSRQNLQRALYVVKSSFEYLLEEFAERNEFPINGFLDIRINCIDDPRELQIENAEPPTLSPFKPVEGKPHFTRVINIDMTGFPNTPLNSQFRYELENHFFQVFNGEWALMRPEWSKRWAYTNEDAFENKTVIKNFIPKAYSTANDSENGWKWTISRFNYYDPYKVFTNEFLEQLFSS